MEQIGLDLFLHPLHDGSLLAELVEETRLGRVIGPCRAPDFSAVCTSALRHTKGMDILQEHPPGDVFAAVSFPILQMDENGDVKLCWGEDWRRTVRATDVPTHHFVRDNLSTSMAQVDTGLPYRQCPVKEPAHCATLLATGEGRWNFNRAADALQLLLRRLLLMVGRHYVDDTRSSPRPPSAPSRALLRSWPQDQELQGAAARHVSHHTGVHLRHPRGEGVLVDLPQTLAQNSLSPENAGAGRCLSFLTQAVFGAIGKAALAPVYSRSHDTAAQDRPELSERLRAALTSLGHLMDNIKPKLIPFSSSGQLFTPT